jgi:hypothetical protein
MIAYKKGHNNEDHIEESLLDRDEAVEFKAFLIYEYVRHQLEIVKCNAIIKDFKTKKILVIAFESAIKSHAHDCDKIAITIGYLNSKFGEM